MQTILILGAGLSSTSLIKYFLDNSAGNGKSGLGISTLRLAQAKIQGHPSWRSFYI